MYDIQFEQAKFVKLTKKGRKPKNDTTKENEEPTIQEIQLKLLNTQINFYNSLCQSYALYNSILKINHHQQHVQQQKPLYPIFTNPLFGKPQTPKANRSKGRSKKNTAALSYD